MTNTVSADPRNGVCTKTRIKIRRDDRLAGNVGLSAIIYFVFHRRPPSIVNVGVRRVGEKRPRIAGRE